MDVLLLTLTPSLLAFPPLLLDFWTERHLCAFTSVREDGSPHAVPVGVALIVAVHILLPAVGRDQGGPRRPDIDVVGEAIERLRELGLQAYRFSVEWARIEPAPGEFSSAALDHYQRMVDTCLAREVQPLVTLHHFTNPLWMRERGGWRAGSIVRRRGRGGRRGRSGAWDLLLSESWVVTGAHPMATPVPDPPAGMPQAKIIRINGLPA